MMATHNVQQIAPIIFSFWAPLCIRQHTSCATGDTTMFSKLEENDVMNCITGRLVETKWATVGMLLTEKRIKRIKNWINLNISVSSTASSQAPLNLQRLWTGNQSFAARSWLRSKICEGHFCASQQQVVVVYPNSSWDNYQRNWPIMWVEEATVALRKSFSARVKASLPHARQNPRAGKGKG